MSNASACRRIHALCAVMSSMVLCGMVVGYSAMYCPRQSHGGCVLDRGQNQQDTCLVLMYKKETEYGGREHQQRGGDRATYTHTFSIQTCSENNIVASKNASRVNTVTRRHSMTFGSRQCFS